MSHCDLTDIVTMMQKVDANHDPSEANALLTAGAVEIARLRALGRKIAGPGSMVECRRKSGARLLTHSRYGFLGLPALPCVALYSRTGNCPPARLNCGIWHFSGGQARKWSFWRVGSWLCQGNSCDIVRGRGLACPARRPESRAQTHRSA